MNRTFLKDKNNKDELIFEAVWFKNGKEIACCDNILDVVLDNRLCIPEIEVYNGQAWYFCDDFCDEIPDDFVIRISKDK